MDPVDILVNETNLVLSLILTGGQLLGSCHSDGWWSQKLPEHKVGPGCSSAALPSEKLLCLSL